MEYVVVICIVMVTASLSYIALNDRCASKLKLFKPTDADEEFVSRLISKKVLIVLCALLTVVSVFTTLTIFDYVSDPIGIAKMLVAFIGMTGAACFDFRERRIPNIFPLFMAVSAVILLAIGVITKQQGAITYVTESIISAVVCCIFFLVAALITAQGIGAGDIKLITALALLGGVYTIVGTLLYGMIACSIVAASSLLLKKKKIKESIPFGPFLYMGFIITVFLKNF